MTLKHPKHPSRRRELYDGWMAYFECPACRLPTDGYMNREIVCEHCRFYFYCLEPMELESSYHSAYNARLALSELFDPMLRSINDVAVKMSRWASDLRKRLRP